MSSHVLNRIVVIVKNMVPENGTISCVAEVWKI